MLNQSVYIQQQKLQVLPLLLSLVQHAMFQSQSCALMWKITCQSFQLVLVLLNELFIGSLRQDIY